MVRVLMALVVIALALLSYAIISYREDQCQIRGGQIEYVDRGDLCVSPDGRIIR